MRRILLLVISVLLALIVVVPTVMAKSSNTDTSTNNTTTNPSTNNTTTNTTTSSTGTVVPPSGDNYKTLSQQWWQWAYKTPKPDNPLNNFTDNSGTLCATGQSGSTWFLGGSFATNTGKGAGTVQRTCNVPAATQLFIPVVNDESSTVEGDPSATDPACPSGTPTLQDCATNLMDHALLSKYNNKPPSTMSVKLDGVQIQNLDPNNTPYRVASGPFQFTLPANNVDNFCPPGGTSPCPAGPSNAAGDGVYLLLAPLSKGQHTLHFKFVGGSFSQPFGEDNTYTLNVS